MKRTSFLFSLGLMLLLVAGTAFSVTGEPPVTDGLGRKVEVPETPDRIITTIPSTTQIILDLGVDERLVGVTSLTQYLSYVPELQAKAEQKEKVGGFEVSLEKVAALEPDLVIVDASAQRELVERLNELDLDMTVYAAGAESIEGVRESILDIGNLTGTMDRATEIVAEMIYKEYRLRLAVEQLEEKTEAFYTISPQMYTTGEDTFLGEVLKLAGLENVFAEIEGFKPVSTEEIIARDPEFIIGTKGMGLTLEDFEENLELEEVTAVREGNLLLLDEKQDSMINQAGTKIMDGTINLFEMVYEKSLEL